VDVDRVIIDRLNALLGELYEGIGLGRQPSGCALSAALSLGLCFANRICKEREASGLRARLAVFSASADVSHQYIPVMNCVFSAQKNSIPIDTCVLGSRDSPFLQQASHITGGVYIRPTVQEGLLQYLFTVMLPDRLSRRFLRLATQNTVDYRAACFCHKKVVDLAYVCSVCLSIFCQYSPQCSTCGTTFTSAASAMGKQKKSATTATLSSS